MKNVFFTLYLICFSLSYIIGSPSKYIEIMEKTINELFQSENLEQYQTVANTFERIGMAEAEEWHPFYYLALTRILMSNQETDSDKKDRFLDQAQSALEIASDRHREENAELLTLKGFITMMRITIDPASRGPLYSGQVVEEFGQAIALDSDNPRAHYLLASMQMGTARFFGSDLDEACSTLQKSIALFDNQGASQHLLDPTWGLDWAESLNEQCQDAGQGND